MRRSAQRPPELRLQLDDDEMVIDNFAGGGGASTGLEMAFGRSPDIAVNHDPEAIAMHTANHPDTKHFIEDVYDIDIAGVVAGRKVGCAWFSPDCSHHSKARGGKPFRDRNRARRIRGLAWIVIKWAKAVKPRVILLENVTEFAEWGPLDASGKVCPLRKGFTFRRWKAQLENLGYVVEMNELRACDYGAPTSRKRLFVIARCDGQAIVWPKPTHAKVASQQMMPYRTAAECIDWSLPCRSIFGRKKPLAENTMRRIAKGIWKYVINSGTPFVIPVTHQGDARVHGLNEPMRTVTGAHRGELALVAPTLIQTSYGERQGQAPRVLDLHQPLGTVVAGGVKHSLVTAFLAKHYSERRAGGWNGGAELDMPFGTVTCQDHHALVTSHLLKLYGTAEAGAPVTDPMPTVTATGWHLAEVRAFLIKFFGTDQDPRLEQPLHTITTRDRFGLILVTIGGDEYVIVDIQMRMLAPHELAAAQGFRAGYKLDPKVPSGKNGKMKPLSRTAQVRMIGNSVSPPMAAALARAQFERAPAGQLDLRGVG
jgi:DNA (cytosine-5)-methyltransferase 1